MTLIWEQTHTGNVNLLVSALPAVDIIFPLYFCIPLLPEDQLASDQPLNLVLFQQSHCCHQLVLFVTGLRPVVTIKLLWVLGMLPVGFFCCC